MFILGLFQVVLPITGLMGLPIRLDRFLLILLWQGFLFERKQGEEVGGNLIFS